MLCPLKAHLFHAKPMTCTDRHYVQDSQEAVAAVLVEPL